jgi:hypothetical protein
MHNYLQDAELEETLLMLQSGLLYLRLSVVEINQNKSVINKNECCCIIGAFVSTAAQGFSKNIQYLVLTRNQHTHI